MADAPRILTRMRHNAAQGEGAANAETTMKTYLVGGAVRDLLMGQTPADRDYVVTGATPAQMEALGFEQVGKDFPVFLHPQTRDEHALARVERRTGFGYGNFDTEWRGVTLEQDLARRDLTCNAMAMDPESGALIDPHGGQRDIEAKTLRHVSDAFREDPVRVLRIARLSAKLGFGIAPETVEMTKAMIRAGELEHLTAERVQKELIKALPQPSPSRFFHALDEMGALKPLFPEVHALKGQTQPPEHHGEGDAYDHTMMVLDAMRDIAVMGGVTAIAQRKDAPKPDVALECFAALVHDLGKGLTPKDKLPSHHGHEEAGVPVVGALCDRLKLPSAYKRIGVKAARHHIHVHMCEIMKPGKFEKIFRETGAANFPYDLSVVARVALADERGKIYDGKRPYDRHERFTAIMTAIASVKITDAYSLEMVKAMKPDRIQEQVSQLRTKAAKSARNGFGRT